jgi:AcrR family transcriptional regulator
VGSAGNGRRRQEYADQTRRAIISAARTLFAERGYGSTKVEDIAKLARVAPITVYSVVGGKSGLLRILMDIWSAAPIVGTTLSSVQDMEDPGAILELVARVVRSMREEFGDIIRVLLDAALHDHTVAESLAIATARYRQSFLTVAQRLATLDALRAELTLEEAADVLWFYFGYWGYFTLHNENKWTYEKAERWLFMAAKQAVLRDMT